MHLKNLGFMILSLWLFGSTAQAASLRGSRQSLNNQAAMARRLHLPHIKNVAQINRLLMSGQLHELPRQGETFYLDDTVGEMDPMHANMYRTASPAVIKFIATLSRNFYRQFDGQRLKITSLVRTAEYQKNLRRNNRNAVAASRSAHLTGAAVDISYKEMTSAEVRWMREQLLDLEKKHMIEATEEHHRACFHIMVFRA